MEVMSILTQWLILALIISWAIGKVWPDKKQGDKENWQKRLHKFLFGGF